MRRLVCLAAVVLLATTTFGCKDLLASLGYLQNADGSACSTTAITAYKVITAAHCVVDETGMTRVDGYTMLLSEVQDRELPSDQRYGLAVYRADRPLFHPVELAIEAPVPGSLSVQIGFGLGAPEPWLFGGLVSQPVMVHPTANPPANVMFFTANGLMGMSGGPVLDKDGRLISIVLGGFDPRTPLQNIGYGVPYERLKAFYLKHAGPQSR